MKNLIVILALFFASGGYAQNYYEFDPDGLELNYTITVGNTKYNVRALTFSFCISNTSNYRTGGKWYYKDGREVDEEHQYMGVETKILASTLEKALAETFTDAEVTAFRKAESSRKPTDGSLLTIYYVIDSNGNTIEVSLIMDNSPVMRALPPAKFATLESNIKKYVKWDVNTAAKALKYVDAFDWIWFNKLTITRPTPPSTPQPGTPPNTNQPVGTIAD